MVEPSKIKELYGVYSACIGIFVCIYRLYVYVQEGLKFLGG